MGYVHVLVSAATINPDGTGERGWIDWSWSRRELFKDRNDATPVMSINTEDEDLTERLRDALEGTLGDGYYYVGGLGQYDSNNVEMDPHTGINYMYTVHLIHKFYGANGYEEEPFILPPIGVSLIKA